MKKLLWYLSFIFILPSCHYFKVISTINNGNSVEGAVKRDKIIIVHDGKKMWLLSYPSVNASAEELYGTKAELKGHVFYADKKRQNTNRYRPRDGNPEREVHLFVTEYSIDSNNLVVIPLASVKKMEVFGLERWSTVLSYSGIIIGGAYLTAALVSFIVLLIIYG